MKTEKPKKRPGPPGNPKISELAEKLSVTRQHAAKLLREGGGTLSELRAQKLAVEIERLELALSRERGEVVLRSDMVKAGERLALIEMGQWDTFAADWPGALAGLNEVEIRKFLLGERDRYFKSVREELAKL